MIGYFSAFIEPHSSVGTVVDFRTGGCWFDPRLGQYSFRGLMIVIVTGFIPLSLLSVVCNNGYVGKQPVAWKRIMCGEKVNPLPCMPILGSSSSTAKKRYDVKNMNKWGHNDLI